LTPSSGTYPRTLHDALPTLTGINARTLAQAAAFWREGAGMKILVRVPLLALGFEPPSRESILAIIDSIRHTRFAAHAPTSRPHRSEEHTSELQSRENLVCRL